MSFSVPVALRIVRTIGLHHWRAGLAEFDGKTPLRILVQIHQSEIWVHSIERHHSTVVCVTRLNGRITDMFEASSISECAIASAKKL